MSDKRIPIWQPISMLVLTTIGFIQPNLII